MIKRRGEGQGVGGPRQRDGGTAICVCPRCGYEIPHTRGVPCNTQVCPKCGTRMVGKSKKYYRWTLRSISQFDAPKFRVMSFDSIKLVIGHLKNELRVQSVLFDTHQWSIQRIKQWIQKVKDKLLSIKVKLRS